MDDGTVIVDVVVGVVVDVELTVVVVVVVVVVFLLWLRYTAPVRTSTVRAINPIAAPRMMYSSRILVEAFV